MLHTGMSTRALGRILDVLVGARLHDLDTLDLCALIFTAALMTRRHNYGEEDEHMTRIGYAVARSFLSAREDVRGTGGPTRA